MFSKVAYFSLQLGESTWTRSNTVFLKSKRLGHAYISTALLFIICGPVTTSLVNISPDQSEARDWVVAVRCCVLIVRRLAKFDCDRSSEVFMRQVSDWCSSASHLYTNQRTSSSLCRNKCSSLGNCCITFCNSAVVLLFCQDEPLVTRNATYAKAVSNLPMCASESSYNGE